MSDPEHKDDDVIRRLDLIKNHLGPKNSLSSVDEAYEKSEWKDILDTVKGRRKKNREPDNNNHGYVRQKTQGKLWVRERIIALVDKQTFREIGSTAGNAKYDEKGNALDYNPANFISGTAKVNQRDVVIAADDFSIRAGHADGAVWGKSIRLIDGSSGGGSVTLALKNGMHDSIASLSEIPVVAAALGPTVGLGAARATLTHFSVMASKVGSLFAAGPPVVANATYETVTKQELGGALLHTSNGTIDNLVETEEECFEQIRQFLSYLPNNTTSLPPRGAHNDVVDRCDDKLLDIIPKRRQRSYQVRDILELVLDQGSWFEIGERWGEGAVCGFGRLNGYAVGILAFDCSKTGSVISTAGSQKFRRHIDLCEVFGLPIVNFADYAGFTIGTKAEKEATIRHGSTLIAALYQGDVPYFSVVLRKVFGVAGAAFVDNRIPNMRVAWPSGDWGSLPLEGGIYAAYKRELDAAGENRNKLYDSILAQFEAVRSPVRTAENFDIPEIIDPRHTRPILCDWVRLMYENILPGRLEKVKVNGPKILYRP
ncbi:carboxyl transferase domain-containing protein [Umbelopsis sp. AD052]|nr:carboxyl transferase domain-containing protein [Umbelopsis sp. AD052]